MSSLVYQCFRLVAGTAYPAYSSYKAVRSKNVRDYVKWMMYWIVFAFYTFVEVFADIFISWLPFYYELKIIFLLWLVLPTTRGANTLYRKMVHPTLIKKERDIDDFIARLSDQCYAALIALGSRGFSFATNIVLTTAIKGQTRLADQLKSFSLTDLSLDTPDGGPLRRFDSNLSLDGSDEADNQRVAAGYQRDLEAEKGRKDSLEREALDDRPIQLRRPVRPSSARTGTETPPSSRPSSIQLSRKFSYPERENLVSSPVSPTVADEMIAHSVPVSPTQSPCTPGDTLASQYLRSASMDTATSPDTAVGSWRSRSSYSTLMSRFKK